VAFTVKPMNRNVVPHIEIEVAAADFRCRHECSRAG
jgi:hypothetical protein